MFICYRKHFTDCGRRQGFGINIFTHFWIHLKLLIRMQVYWRTHRIPKKRYKVIAFYSDKLLLTWNWNAAVTAVQETTSSQFKIRVGSENFKFLRMAIEKFPVGIFIHNGDVNQKVLCCVGIDNSKPCAMPLPAGFGSLSQASLYQTNIKTYHTLIRCLMYWARTTWPDLAYATRYFTCYLQNRLRAHWTGAKSILKYFHETQTFELFSRTGGKGLFRVL